MKTPRKDAVKRYLLTCAQNNTEVHKPTWENILALAEYYDATIYVSRVTYIVTQNQASNDKLNATGKKGAKETLSVTWDPAVARYVNDEQVHLAPSLIWCGNTNTSPTAKRPLSQVGTYTGEASGIFPHAKVAMTSIPVNGSDNAKFVYTTGTVTVPNYINRRAGLEATFHHTLGALLVEVLEDGTWFCRQIVANSEGTICDLDLIVDRGRVTSGNTIESITWGDIHVDVIEPMVARLGWGYGADQYDDGPALVDFLMPKSQYLHDTLDFHRRNHHNVGDFFFRYSQHKQQKESVEQEVTEALDFILASSRPYCVTRVVASNHDEALYKWLKAVDFKEDPVNAKFFLKCTYMVLDTIDNGGTAGLLPQLLQERVEHRGVRPNVIEFLDVMSSSKIGPAHSQIECAMHGHLGPNGARGGVQSLVKTSLKANIGHSHSAAILDGLYCAGTSSKLRIGYNQGPSTWSHSHILTYANGKRTILTMNVKTGRSYAPRPARKAR